VAVAVVGFLIRPVEPVDLVAVVVAVVVMAVLLEQQELQTRVAVVDRVPQALVVLHLQVVPVDQESSSSDMQCQQLQLQHHLLD
jgi:hypothetical protein